MSKSKYADSVVELDTRIGRIMDKLRALGLDKDTLVVYTSDNGACQDVYPDAGYTPFRDTKGTVREGGNRAPAIAVWPGKIKPGSKSHDIVGGLDLMATFAALGGVKLPEKDREGQPMMFDSVDMSRVLFGTAKLARKPCFYFTENELSPGAARGDLRLDEDLCAVPAAQAAEHGPRRADRDLQVPEVPVRARDAAKGRHQHPAAHRQLKQRPITCFFPRWAVPCWRAAAGGRRPGCRAGFQDMTAVNSLGLPALTKDHNRGHTVAPQSTGIGLAAPRSGAPGGEKSTTVRQRTSTGEGP
jgi:hypothetical protein